MTTPTPTRDPDPDPGRRDVLDSAETMLSLHAGRSRRTITVPAVIALLREMRDEVAALRPQLAAAERAGLAGNLDVIDHLSDAAQRLTAERDRLAAEVAALRADNRTLRLTMRTVRNIAADRAEKVAEIAPLLDVDEDRALTEDTPVCPHSNGAGFYCDLPSGHDGEHVGYWWNPHVGEDREVQRLRARERRAERALTEDTPAVVQCDECETTGQNCRAHKTTPAHCTCEAIGTLHDGPECPLHAPESPHAENTPDTPDTPTEKATAPGGRCPGCGGRLAEYRAVPEFDVCEKCGAEWPVDPPPDCTTCNDQRRIADPPGNSFGMGVPCPDCTEDTP